MDVEHRNTNKPPKIVVGVRLGEVPDHILTGDLESIAFKLLEYGKNLTKNFGSFKFTNIRLNAEEDYEGLTVSVWADREETDSEYQSRMALLENKRKAKLKQEEKERETLKRLKAKYEPQS